MLLKNHRAIALDRIVLVSEDARLRERLDQQQIKDLADLYREDVKVDPIEVLLIQTGDPSQNQYALLDGHHRFEAIKSLKLIRRDAVVEARIDTSITVTEDTLDTATVKNYIQLKQASFNCKQGIKPKTSDRKNTAIALTLRGVSLDDIAATALASRSQIHRWTADIARKKKREKIEIARASVTVGSTAVQAAETANLSRSTVERIKSQEKEARALKGDGVIDHETALQSVSKVPHGTFDTLSSGMPTIRLQQSASPKKQTLTQLPLQFMAVDSEQSKKFSISEYRRQVVTLTSQEQLDIIYETIKALSVDAEVEEQMSGTIISLITSRFKSIKKTIKGGGYALVAQNLTKELEESRKAAAAFSAQAREQKQKVENLDEQLKKRTSFCSYSCQYTKDRLQREAKKTAHGLLSQILKYTESGLENRKAKTVPTLQLLFNKLKEQGNEEAVTLFTRQTITDWTFSLVSYLEWAMDVGIMTSEVGEYIGKIEIIIASSKIKVKELSDRTAALKGRASQFKGNKSKITPLRRSAHA